jgi:integrase
MKLTNIQIKQAKPKDKPYKMTDGKGLYLLVNPDGSKYWRLKYRILGREKLKSLGVYPEITLADARLRREEARKIIESGNDPVAEERHRKLQKQLKAAQTFESIAREWHKQNYETWSQRHAEGILSRLERDIFPVIGKDPITNLTPPIILACIRKIEGRNANEMARRAMQMCSQVFRYAVATGRTDRDITVDLKGALKKFKRGHFASIESDEIPALLRAIEENKPRLFRQTILATKLMMLTFVRTSELIEAKWTEFDLDKHEWVIPAERMKMRRSHIVPLSKQALTLLKEQKEFSGKREHVFPSIPRPQKPMSNATILAGLKRMGYKDKMTGHGFRALAMSTLKEKLGYPHDIVDRQLAHAPRNRVDAAYDRAQYLPQRKKMMQEWADYLERTLQNKILYLSNRK